MHPNPVRANNHLTHTPLLGNGSKSGFQAFIECRLGEAYSFLEALRAISAAGFVGRFSDLSRRVLLAADQFGLQPQAEVDLLNEIGFALRELGRLDKAETFFAHSQASADRHSMAAAPDDYNLALANRTEANAQKPA